MHISLGRYGDLLRTYLRPQRQRAALLAVLLLSSIGLQLLNPQILRYFVDTALARGALSTLLLAALLFIVVALVTQALSVAATYVGEQVEWLATNNIRADLAAHCLHLDLAFHNLRTPGELIERIDGDVNALASFFSQFVIRVLGSVLLLFGVLVLLFREDWRVGCALTVFSLVALFALSASRGIAVPAIAAERQAYARFFGFLEERLAGIEDLRPNGAGDYVMRRFHQATRELFLKSRRAGLISNNMWVITSGLFTAGYILALALGAYLWRRQEITIGTVYLIVQYTDLLRRPLEQISEQLKEFQRAAASIGRLDELFAFRSTLEDGPGATLPPGPLSVELDHVSFGYGEDELVLDDISWRLAPSRVLGLLGRTGSGKTTMTRLLLRLYDPQAGAIRLGGRDIRDLRLADLRQCIGMVTQDVQLFRASLRDNLTLFDDAISDERIHAVLRELELWDWYRSLPNGLDTELAPESSGLSAGEAQLLAFTRVFLKDPGLVILDEASSRLDPATEALIERAVDKLLHGRTGIVIAHRLHTVERADEIMILEDGRIREHGPRRRLSEDPGSRLSQLLRTGIEEVLV